jgi:lipopolysaccharide/colanic/teichoic acid biosynthesis glycosyltransferase
MLARYFVKFLLACSDISAIFIAYYLGWLTRFKLVPFLFPGFVHVEQHWTLYYQIILPSSVLIIFLAAHEGLYQFGHGVYRRHISGSIRTVILLFLLSIAYIVFFRLNFEFSRAGTMIALGYLLLIMPLMRVALLSIVIRLNLLVETALIIGCDQAVEEFFTSIDQLEYARFNRIVGHFNPAELFGNDQDSIVPAVEKKISNLVKNEGLNKVIILMEGIHRDVLANILREFEIRIRLIKLVPDASSMALLSAKVVNIESNMMLCIERSIMSPFNSLFKRVVDIFVCLLLLPFVLLVVVLAMPFLKFKPLMFVSRYDLTGRRLKIPQLAVDYAKGGFLFQTGLYKLPEIFGVLVGKQSFVGPAPLIKRELEYYKDSGDTFRNVKPGITGLWQVSDYGYFREEQRLSLDMMYVVQWSPMMDLDIVVHSLIKGLVSLCKPRRGLMRT